MATKKSSKKFHVQARVWVDVGVEVAAQDLADAVEAGKGLKLDDFITIKGDHNDSGYRITGLFEAHVEPVI